MRKIQFLLFIFILFLSPRVFAQEFNVSTSNITSPNSSGTGKYTGTEIYNSGTSNVYNIGTRYNGRLSRIVFNLSSGGYADADGFEKGHTYTLTMNMATEDWRNNFGSVSVKCEGSSGQELSNGRVSYISYKKIKFSFTAPSDSYCQFVYIDLKSTNISSVAFTGVSNWNLSSLVIEDPAYCSGSSCGSSGGSSGGSSTDATNQDIINNQNNNTNSIINNQDNNTEDIIENNNNNTQSIIDNQNKACPVETVFQKRDLYLAEMGYLDSSGNIQSGAYQVSKYLEIKPDEEYEINFNFQSTDPIYSCLYNGRKQVTRCLASNSRTLSFTSANNEYYLRVSGTIRNAQLFPIYIKGSICNNWELEAQNDIKNTITDDNIDNGLGGGFFDNFDDQDFGLSSIITIPLNTIQSLTSQSCMPLNIPIPFTGRNVSLPCMTQVYEDNIPSIYNLWKVVSFGIIAYFIAIDIFHMVKGFKDPESDKVEVLDL